MPNEMFFQPRTRNGSYFRVRGIVGQVKQAAAVQQREIPAKCSAHTWNEPGRRTDQIGTQAAPAETKRGRLPAEPSHRVQRGSVLIVDTRRMRKSLDHDATDLGHGIDVA